MKGARSASGTYGTSLEAEFSDGVKRDVTSLTQFVSNDGLAQVMPTGLVKIIRAGRNRDSRDVPWFKALLAPTAGMPAFDVYVYPQAW